MTTIKGAVDDLFNNQQLPADEAVDRHYGPTFRQRTNGSWNDRAQFLARIADLRKVVERPAITVLDELAGGNRYAERYVVDLRLPGVNVSGCRVRQDLRRREVKIGYRGDVP